MKFLAVALDYDGTIAVDGVLHSTVRDAIAELRSKNIIVVIATGRILSELQRVCGGLEFVDAVVAENGASIYFPDSGYSRLLGEPAPQNLIQAIRLEGGECRAGESVVEMDAKEATRVLATVQRLELPFSILFNRGRLMILPQGISKATGLREVFQILRLSPHNAVAIGDAENDHQLLKFCEFGVAVGWGSNALKATADYVLPGDGPQAVSGFLRRLANTDQIPVSTKKPRSLALGRTDTGALYSLTVHDQKVLIAGDTKSGKSWVTGLLSEQLILLGYSLLIIDPEGDYLSLEALPNVTVYTGTDPLPRPRELIRALRHADVSVVVDLSHTGHDARVEYVETLLSSLKVLRERTGLPHCVVLDEAHYFLHKQKDEQKLCGLNLEFCILVSYRTSMLHPSILRCAESILITRESEPKEVFTLSQLCPAAQEGRDEVEWQRMLGNLALEEAVALPVTPESKGEATRIHLAPRLTPHVRHIAKYVDLPVSESLKFVFWQHGKPSGRYAHTLHQLVTELEGDAPEAFRGHLQRQDFSRWIADVFGDFPTAEIVAEAERRSLKGDTSVAVQDIVKAIRARYDMADALSGLK